MSSPTDLPSGFPDVANMHAELVGLRASFLVNTGKLAIICSRFGIHADLEETHDKPFFSRAVDERLKREAMVRREVATLKDSLMILRKIAQGADEQTRLYHGPEDDARLIERQLREDAATIAALRTAH